MSLCTRDLIGRIYHHIRLKVYGAARNFLLGGVVEGRFSFPEIFYSFFPFPPSWLTREVQEQGPVALLRLMVRALIQVTCKPYFNRGRLMLRALTPYKWSIRSQFDSAPFSNPCCLLAS